MAIKTITTSKGIALAEIATFNIRVASDFSVGSNIAPHYLIKYGGKLSALFPCKFDVKTPPTGSDAIMDILYTPPGDVVGGVTTKSIFNSGGAKITLSNGSFALQQTIDFDPSIILETDGRLSFDIIQKGSSTAGQCAAIILMWLIGS